MTKYITMHKLSEKGTWYCDTHLTPAEAIATLFEQGNEYPNSVTRILKYEDNKFIDISDEIGEEAQSSFERMRINWRRADNKRDSIKC